MNTPSILTLILGNLLGCALTVTAGGYIILRSVIEPDGPLWLGVIFGIAVIARAAQARLAFSNYRAFNKSWKQASGSDRPPAKHLRLRQLVILSFGAWVGCWYWLDSYGPGVSLNNPAALLELLNESSSRPVTGAAALFFAIPCAWTCWACLRAMRLRADRKEQQQAGKPDIVTIALPVPRSMAAFKAPRQALPDYCKQLMDRKSVK